MESIVLTDPGSRSQARVAAHLGFNCHVFQADLGDCVVDVIAAAEDFAAGGQKPSWHGIPILFPFPNRIRGGKFRWAGKDYHLPPDRVGYDSAGNAIHGFCLDRPWRVVKQEQDLVIGQFQLSIDAKTRKDLWPADFFIEVTYRLHGPVLRADIRIANPDSVPLPWGFGTHPYFRLPLGGDSDPARCLVQAPAAEMWELVDCLPTGKRIPVPEDKDLRDGEYFDVLKLDDVYTGVSSASDAMECGIIDEQAGLQVIQRCDPIYREIVAYTPDGRPAVCLEPYTCVTDAVNLQQQGVDAGWRTLEPGEEFRTWIEIRAGKVIA